MIKGLMGISGITIAGGNTAVPYIPQISENPIQGMIRIWGSDMQVFTGSGWQTLSTSYATASLDQDILDILAWARKERDKQLEYDRMAKDHPAVKIAYDNFQKSRQQLEVTVKLSQDTTEQIQWHPV
jgi:hypothetical protein